MQLFQGISIKDKGNAQTRARTEYGNGQLTYTFKDDSFLNTAQFDKFQ